MRSFEKGMAFTCRLSSRALIRVSGVGAHALLQDLFTNDLRALHPGGSMWGCFLHHTGRVLADAHLYHSARAHDGQSSVFVDVHRDVADAVEAHLRDMRMRKKAKIERASPALAVFAAAGERRESESKDSESFADPRSAALPLPLRKLIAPAETDIKTKTETAITPEIKSEIKIKAEAESDGEADFPYRALLCASGVGEGPAVFRPHKSLPFEANADFLGGVSFRKGCYLGQELTHRTHVMLVTRKRTVPLRFAGARRHVAAGEKLFAGGREAGAVLETCGGVGLGLVRLRFVDAESRKVPQLALHDAAPVEMEIPHWWPEAEVKKMLLKP